MNAKDFDLECRNRWTPAAIAALASCDPNDPATWPPEAWEVGPVYDPKHGLWEEVNPRNGAYMRRLVIEEAVNRRAWRERCWMDVLIDALSALALDATIEHLLDWLSDALTETAHALTMAAIDVVPAVMRRMSDDHLRDIMCEALAETDGPDGAGEWEAHWRELKPFWLDTEPEPESATVLQSVPPSAPEPPAPKPEIKTPSPATLAMLGRALKCIGNMVSEGGDA